MIDAIEIPKPDDAHLHVRDGAMLRTVLPFTAQHFARAVIMPNLDPPITSVEAATAYRARIIAALPARSTFTPFMTAYLTQTMTAEELLKGYSNDVWIAAKLYPAHATTNSSHGVTDIFALMPVFEAMARVGMPLLVHGEVTDPTIDIFDREAVFIDRILMPLTARLPELKIVFEHITTRRAVEFVRAAPITLAATITIHHLLYNRNALFQGGLRPHYYCLPLLKTEPDRLSLVDATISGEAKFFLGTDSAPHLRHTKEATCGCAGIFSAPAALPLYASVFDSVGRIDRLGDFAARNAARFYGWPETTEMIRLRRAPTLIPPFVTTESNETIVALCGGETIAWKVD